MSTSANSQNCKFAFFFARAEAIAEKWRPERTWSCAVVLKKQKKIL
jgi:hypothetical protein